MSNVQVSEETLFSQAAPIAARKSRFTQVGDASPTKEGTVALARDGQGTPYLVHTVGRQTEAVALHAVAVAVAGGAVNVKELAGAFQAAGRLEELEKAVAAVKSGK